MDYDWLGWCCSALLLTLAALVLVGYLAASVRFAGLP